jgi:hypothetical protein
MDEKAHPSEKCVLKKERQVYESYWLLSLSAHRK